VLSTYLTGEPVLSFKVIVVVPGATPFTIKVLPAPRATFATSSFADTAVYGGVPPPTLNVGDALPAPTVISEGEDVKIAVVAFPTWTAIGKFWPVVSRTLIDAFPFPLPVTVSKFPETDALTIELSELPTVYAGVPPLIV